MIGQLGTSIEVATIRNQLLVDGLIEQKNGVYKLTDRGKKYAEKQLDRYKFQPGKRFLIGMHFAEMFGIDLI